jgi:hypothetical protein
MSFESEPTLKQLEALDDAASHPEREQTLKSNMARRDRFIAAQRKEIDALRGSGSPQEQISEIEASIHDFEVLNETDREQLRIFEATK